MQNSEQYTAQNPDPSLALAEAFEAQEAAAPFALGRQYAFSFKGTAAEYFGIWIVNILLTIITLGFYAPWAKVRRLRYFYGNTWFIQRRFDFTGVPVKILAGRIIALLVYGAFSYAMNHSASMLMIAGDSSDLLTALPVADWRGLFAGADLYALKTMQQHQIQAIHYS